MQNLFRLWSEGGFFGYPILLFFIVAVVMLVVQLVIARKRIFPGLFLGWSTTILALSVLAAAVGYKLALGVLVAANDPNPGLVFKATEVVLVLPCFSLAMVTLLLVLQLAADGWSGRGSAGPSGPARAARMLGGFALLGLVVGGLFSVRAMLILNGLSAYRAPLAGENADAIHAYLTSGIVAGISAVVLGLATVVVSVIAGVRKPAEA